jgi:hypothetical protein
MPPAHTHLHKLLLSLFRHKVHHLRTFIGGLSDGDRLNVNLGTSHRSGQLTG